MKKKLLIVSFVFFYLFVSAQTESPELITDRPDQTESSAVIPVKYLQIETGFVLENDETDGFKTKIFSYNTTLFRYGIFENTELRLGFDFLGMETETNGIETSAKGLGPMYAGFKTRLIDENGVIPEIAFLGGLILPATASDDFKPSNTAPSMRFAFSHTLSEKLSLGYNLGSEWDGESPIPGYYYSIALGIGITEAIGAFLESFGTIPEEDKSQNLIDAGLTFLVMDNLQLDISGGLGLNDEAIDSFIGFGLSVRLPK